MRESRDEWGEVPAGCNAYAIGDRVCGALDGLPGMVTSVEPGYHFVVKWDEGIAVAYPEDSIMIRRAMPWE